MAVSRFLPRKAARMPRSYIGRLERTSTRPDDTGAVSGREVFIVTRHDDGSRTLTSHGEIDDYGSVVRDVITTVDRDWYPMDASVRITVGGKFTGSAWFRFADGYAECESFTANEGRVRQRMATDGRLKGFGTHSLANDAWWTGLYDLAKGPGVLEIPYALLSSADHRGATGPSLFHMGGRFIYVGPDRTTTRAGTFDSLHFQFAGSRQPGGYPPYNLWVTNDGNFTMLIGRVEGHIQRQFELVSLADL